MSRMDLEPGTTRPHGAMEQPSFHYIISAEVWSLVDNTCYRPTHPCGSASSPSTVSHTGCEISISSPSSTWHQYRPASERSTDFRLWKQDNRYASQNQEGQLCWAHLMELASPTSGRRFHRLSNLKIRDQYCDA